MNHFTYLLGAGASAKALPLIKNVKGSEAKGLPQELLTFVQRYTSQILTESPGWGQKEISNLIDISKRCIEFGTPDLFAKFLLETGDVDQYKILKNLLSIYFKYEQTAKQAFDYRALTFLTTISQNERIPSNINILSWNYDTQIEIAAKKLKSVKDKTEPCIKGFSTWPNINEGFGPDHIPLLLHLNGVAGYHHSKLNESDEIDSLLSFTNSMSRDLLLSFVWEQNLESSNESIFKRKLSMIKGITQKTNILIIIGYSFPFFNRSIDKILFKQMKESLTKIYIQDPFNDGKALPELFDLSDSVKRNIVHIGQVENYHIPFEM